MIYARTYQGISKQDADIMDIPPEEPSFQLIFTSSEDIKSFYLLLQRSLNCAPEFGKDWFELSDKLEKFLAPSSSD
jgi:hypothetical protein